MQTGKTLVGNRQVVISADLDALSRSAAQRIVDCAQEAIADHGTFFLALSGGSTPKHLHQILAEPAYQRLLEWGKVHVYFGDERNVPIDHPDSNYKMAMDTLLSSVPIPSDQIHPIPTCCDDMQACAIRYAEELSTLPQQQGIPRFDMVLLGTGNDGHTASLFPGTPILDEMKRTVAAVFVPRLDSWRVSLTYPVLNQARHVMVLVSGSGKSQILSEIFYEPDRQYPIQKIENKNVEWFVDSAAAARLIENDVGISG